MNRYVTAALSPFGRLPLLEYWFYIIPATLLTMVIKTLIAGNEDPSAVGMAAVLLMIWIAFCVTSRRLQDMGYPGALCFPIFALSAIGFLAEIDPKLLGENEDAFVWLDFCQSLAGAGLILTIGFSGIMCKSTSGPNIYGPEFGAPETPKTEFGDAGNHEPGLPIAVVPQKEPPLHGTPSGIISPRRREPAGPGKPKTFGRR